MKETGKKIGDNEIKDFRKHIIGKYLISAVENLMHMINFLNMPYTLRLIPNVHHPEWDDYSSAHKTVNLDFGKENINEDKET